MIRLFGLLWSRREFIQGVGLMILPHHKAGHEGGPKPEPGEPGPSGLLLLMS